MFTCLLVDTPTGAQITLYGDEQAAQAAADLAPPEAVTRLLSVSPDALLANLTAEQRQGLRRDLRRADTRTAEAAMLAKIRETVAAACPDEEVAGVVFTTMEFDNGYFLSDITAEVYFADGSSWGVEFDIADLLTAEYGACGVKAALMVDLRTGTFTFDDYGCPVDPFSTASG